MSLVNGPFSARPSIGPIDFALFFSTRSRKLQATQDQSFRNF